MILQEAYKKRPIRYLGLVQEAGWKLKMYGIAYNRAQPRAELIDSAKMFAGQILPQPAVTDSRYGVGFIGVHDGRNGNFIFIDWWVNENELVHHVYTSPSEHPTRLQYGFPSGVVACAWDLALIAHERQAWVDCVLANIHGPDFDAYFDRQLNTEL